MEDVFAFTEEEMYNVFFYLVTRKLKLNRWLERLIWVFHYILVYIMWNLKYCIIEIIQLEHLVLFQQLFILIF